MDLAIATYSELAALERNDRLLIPALAKVGLVAAPVRWDDPQFDWSLPKLTLIRSTWDYHRRLLEFLAWADHVDRVGRLANPASIVRWNSHKSYLRELAEKGVPVLRTEWLSQGEPVELGAVLRRAGLERAVVKGAVSAGALDVMVVDAANAPSHQARLATVLERTDVLVQPFLPHLHEHGEISAVFFEGALKYGIHRPAGLHAPGVIPPTTSEVGLSPRHHELAEATLRACPSDALYARVDMAQDDRGELVVMEVEMIEPALYFSLVEGSADWLAQAIARRIGAK